jgi:hypothetical protein
MQLFDRINIDDQAGVRITGDGYLVANPRISRTGIQLYRGSEVGVKDKKIVRVYRPATEVFHEDAMRSMAHRPLTNDHPPVPVTADNWKDFAIGQSGDAVARDGECLRVPMVFMDGAAIKDIQNGKKQLSVGYTCDVKIESGMTPDTNEPYDAIQTNIRGNHIALVKAARGGDRLTVGDAPPQTVVDTGAVIAAAEAIKTGKVDRDTKLADANSLLAPGYPMGKDGTIYVSVLESSKKEANDSGDEAVVSAIDSLLKLIGDGKQKGPAMKTMTVDGITCEMSDTAIEVVQRALANSAKLLKDANEKAEEEAAKFKKKTEEDAATITTLSKDKETLTAEVATLKKQAEDSAMTPDKLDAMVKDRAEISGKAKAILGDKLVVDGKSTADIKRQVVDAKLGDAAKGWTDDQVSVSFATLTAGVKATDSAAPAAARAAFAAPHINDADPRDAAYAKRDKQLADAWKGPAANA